MAMPTLPIPPQKILQAFHTDYSYMCTCFPAIFDGSFGWGLRTPNLGEEEAVGGWGMVPFERALVRVVSSYATGPP